MKVDYSNVVLIGSLTMCGTYMVMDIVDNVSRNLGSQPVAETTTPPKPLAGIVFTRNDTLDSYIEKVDEVTLEDLYAAIRIVESNGNPDAVGDHGQAIGCYQIWRDYWQDATEFSNIGGSYNDCFNCDYAHEIVIAYMNRYATEDRLKRPVTFEDIARIHNGGPNGYRKESTKKYWTKVANILYK